MTRLWSHSVAQGGRRITLPSGATGIFIPSLQGNSIREADPPEMAEALLQYAVDEQEALSRRYGRNRLQLLLLRSGNVAVFDSTYQLRCIQDGMPSRQQLEEWTRAQPEETKPQPRVKLEDLM